MKYRIRCYLEPTLEKKIPPILFKVHYRWFASYGFKTMEVEPRAIE